MLAASRCGRLPQAGGSEIVVELAESVLQFSDQGAVIKGVVAVFALGFQGVGGFCKIHEPDVEQGPLDRMAGFGQLLHVAIGRQVCQSVHVAPQGGEKNGQHAFGFLFAQQVGCLQMLLDPVQVGCSIHGDVRSQKAVGDSVLFSIEHLRR